MQETDLDSYTGLYRRRFALEAMERMCLDSAGNGHKVGLIYLDVDRMKSFNDSNSHEVGDRMLFKWARVLEGLAPEGALLSRWGGDEFIVVVSHSEVDEILELAECIRARIAGTTVSYRGKTYGPLTVTIGVSTFPDDGETALKLLEEADLAVVIGKNHGKNCVLLARNPLRRDAPPY